MERIKQIFDAKPGTDEADELEVLSTLVELYERSSIPAPSPVAAIKFRMAQDNLTARDLEPYLGSRARVSEILSGQRTLTIDMMRALNKHLGIPAEALLSSGPPSSSEATPEPSARAFRDLLDTGLVDPGETFLSFVGRGFGNATRPAMLRKSRTDRTNAKTDVAALHGWCAAVLLKSRLIRVSPQRPKTKYNADLARKVAQVSAHPAALQEIGGFLARIGIALVVLRHLPGTYLDGAAMLRDDGVPVIALTLRHDRIDNFWFTLLHEFAHVACHIGHGTSVIFDDLEIGSAESIEEEADRFAQQALIPDDLCSALARPDFDVGDVDRLARRAGVHSAIVAGRWQREHHDYRRFSKLVGHGEVRRVLA